MMLSIKLKNPVRSTLHRVWRLLNVSLAGFITRPQADLKSAPRSYFERACMVTSAPLPIKLLRLARRWASVNASKAN
jgi:hypothetical protein